VASTTAALALSTGHPAICSSARITFWATFWAMSVSASGTLVAQIA
jgi:hypothetical protein